MGRETSIQRVVLIVIAVVVLVSVGATWAFMEFTRDPETQSAGGADRSSANANDRRRPSLAIATTESLEQIINELQADEESAPPAGGEAVSDGEAPKDQADLASDLDDYSQMFADPSMQQALVNIYADGLAGELAGYFNRTGRFSVIDPSQVYRAFNELVAGAPEPEQTGETLIQRVGEAFRVRREGGASTAANQLAADFVKISEGLGLDYLLILDLGEPSFTTEIQELAYTNDRRLVVQANPTFVYLLYDINNGGYAVAADQARLAEGLEVELTPSMLRDGLSDAEAQSVKTELSIDHYNRVAASISGAVVNALFPATVAAVGPIVITRGASDGVRVGDEFSVYRIGEDLADAGGVQIEGHRQQIATVRVTQADPNVSVVEAPPDSGVVQVGDRVDFAVVARTDDPSITPSQQGAGASSGPAPAVANRNSLGASPIDDRSARVAVGDFEFSLASEVKLRGDQLELEMQRAFNRSLSGDPRFAVLSRQDLDRIQEEYRLARQGGMSGQGADRASVDIAGYLVTGSVRIDLEETEHSVSLGGQVRNAGASYRLIASGEISIVDTMSTIMAAERVEVVRELSGAEEARQERIWSEVATQIAEDGARLLRVELYPLKVADAYDGRVIINAGSDRLAPGQRLRAYSQGEAIRDPDTGTVLARRAREFVGYIRIVDADDAVSFAEYVDGDLDLEAGDPLELAEADRAPAATAASVADDGSASEPTRDRPF